MYNRGMINKRKKTRQRYPVNIFGQESERNYLICKLHIVERLTFRQLAKKYKVTEQRINNIIHRYEDKFVRVYYEGRE